MLTKEECEKAFKRLNGMIVTSPFEEDLIDCNDLKKYDTQLQNDFMDDVMVFMQLIEEHFNPQPYKFEELKRGMWVWDDKFKDCMKIKIIFKPCKSYPNGSLKAYHDLNEETLNFIEFEEGRFFPVTKALEYQNES